MSKILDRVIFTSISNYPSLYKNIDYKTSKLLILDHLFFVTGNGYYWKDGCLQDAYTKESQKVVTQLPEDYFNYKLYMITISDAELKITLEELQKISVYTYVCSKEYNKIRIYYHSDTIEMAKEIHALYDMENSHSYVYELCYKHPLDPYPLSDYSALVRISEGIFENPRSDWIDGCTEIAYRARDYYLDPEQYRNHMYYKDLSKNINGFNKYKKDQLNYIDKYLEQYS